MNFRVTQKVKQHARQKNIVIHHFISLNIHSWIIGLLLFGQHLHVYGCFILKLQTKILYAHLRFWPVQRFVRKALFVQCI